jgi:hypothetical protein
MADFPRVGVIITSEERIVDEAMVSRSRAGRVRVRRLYPSATKEFGVVLNGLTDAERDSVDQFLALNRMDPFRFFWPRYNQWYQVVWLDSSVRWQDVGNRLSSANLTFALA